MVSSSFKTIQKSVLDQCKWKTALFDGFYSEFPRIANFGLKSGGVIFVFQTHKNVFNKDVISLDFDYGMISHQKLMTEILISLTMLERVLWQTPGRSMGATAHFLDRSYQVVI